MKKVSVLLAGIFLVLIMCNFASALNTTLVLHGPPFHYQIVRVLDPTTKAVITSLYPGEHYTGITESSFLTTNTEVTFLVIDRHNRMTKATYEDFDNYPTGGTIELWLPGAFNNTGEDSAVEETNVSDVNESEETELNESEDNETIILNESDEEADIQEINKTGFSVSGMVGGIGEKLNNKYVYYGGASLLGAVILLLVIIKGYGLMVSKRKRRLPEGNAAGGSPLGKLKDAESKLRELEKDIEELKRAEVLRAERRQKLIERRKERLKKNKD